MKLRRAAAMAAAFLMLSGLLPLAGCREGNAVSSDSAGTDSQPAESEASAASRAGDFTLAYSSGDTLNPFKAATRQNWQLGSLLYEGLTALDGSLVAQPALAASVTQADSLTLRAVLRDDARFSDGSSVTAADVIQSFQNAKASSHYGELLENIVSASAEGDRTAVFILSSPDPHAAACLSFPVVKSGTGDVPVGTGYYRLETGEQPILRVNAYHTPAPGPGDARLVDLTAEDEIRYALESGAISFLADELNQGEIPTTSSATRSYPLNSLVYLGVNAKRDGLSQPATRQALNLALDRSELVGGAFAGRALAAVSPFNPLWQPASALNNFEIKENVESAVAQFQQAGYNSKDGKMPSWELLVNTGNSFRTTAAELIRQQMAKAGVTITIVPLAFEEFQKRLQSGNFDLYLGEVRLSANMSLNPLLAARGGASYGVDTGGSASAAYAAYRGGAQTIEQFADAFAVDLPYLPLCWREGMAAYNRALSGVEPGAYNIFYAMENWVYAP